MPVSLTAPTEMSANTAQMIAASAMICVILIISALAVPYGAVSLGANTGFLPAFGSLTCMGDLMTALLLFGQARALNDRSYARLGGAYLFSSFIIIPHLMAFPGVFSPTPLIGASASAVWLWAIWHGGFAIAIINFAVRRDARLGGPVRILPIVAGVGAAVLSLAAIATVGEPLLPTILVDGNYARLTSLGIAPGIAILNVTATILVALRLRDKSVLTLWLLVATVAATADVCLTTLGGGRYTFGWYLARGLSLVAGFSVLVALLTEFIALFGRVAVANMTLERLSLTDALTGLGNRRAFDKNLDKAWRGAVREQMPLSLVMIDIDHFKRYNDRYGHPAGDVCLRDVAAVLATRARRPWDMAARMGGEEFGVLLPQTDAAGAMKVAETFREEVEALALPHLDNVFDVVTISVGVATVYQANGDMTREGLIAAADAALYESKIGGRNRVSEHRPIGLAQDLAPKVLVVTR